MADMSYLFRVLRYMMFGLFVLVVFAMVHIQLVIVKIPPGGKFCDTKGTIDNKCFDLEYRSEDAAEEALSIIKLADSDSDDAECKVQDTPSFSGSSEESGLWTPENISLEAGSSEVKPLCILEDQQKLVYCNKIARDLACLGIKGGTVAKCNRFSIAEFAIPVCLEEKSEMIVACKLTSAHICRSNNISDNPMSSEFTFWSDNTPCQHGSRKLCLSDNGHLRTCKSEVAAEIIAMATTVSPIPTVSPTPFLKRILLSSDKFEVVEDWWKEWRMHIPGLVKKEPEKNRKWLCIPEDNKDRMLVDCSLNFTFHACIKAKSGEMKQCMNTDKGDFPVPICREESSGKIISCYEKYSGYMCFSTVKPSTIVPCQFQYRQVCVGENGLVGPCLREEEIGESVYFDPLTDRPVWMNWWQKWLHINSQSGFFEENEEGYSHHTLLHLDMYRKYDEQGNPMKKLNFDMSKVQHRLCRLEGTKYKVRICGDFLEKSSLCVSVRYGNVNDCTSYDKASMPIPICAEEQSHKIITCHGQYHSTYLCFERNDNVSGKYLVYPCRSENFHNCLNENGKFGRCQKSTNDPLQNVHHQEFGIRHRTKRSTTNERIEKPGQNPLLDELRQLIEDISEDTPDFEVYKPRIAKFVSMWHEENFILSNGTVPPNSTLVCKDNENGKFFQCENLSPESTVCTSVQREILDVCGSFDEEDMAYYLCVEKSSNKVIACGHGVMKGRRTILCKLEKEGETTVEPCTDEADQLCLNANTGEIEKCNDFGSRLKRNAGNHNIRLHTQEYEPLIKIIRMLLQASKNETMLLIDSYLHSILIFRSWWSEWNFGTSNDTEKKPPANSTRLCSDNKAEDKLSYCFNESSNLNTCVSIYLGEINDCERFNDEDMPLSICVDEPSKKLTTCGDIGAFLCKLKNEEDTISIQPCEFEERQICLNTDKGKLKLCTAKRTRHKRNVQYYQNAEFWIDYWREWIEPPKDLTVKFPEKEIKDLCLAKSKELIHCPNKKTNGRACISANQSYVDKCWKLQDSEAPIPICIEIATNKVITCGNHIRAYLCHPESGHLKPTRPCHAENRQICYFQKFFENCNVASLNRGKRFSEVDSQTSSPGALDADMSPLHHDMASSFFAPLLPQAEMQNLGQNAELLQKETKYSCADVRRKVTECTRDMVYQELCISTKDEKKGWIDFCKSVHQYKLAPICQDVPTDALITCGLLSKVNLCQLSNNYFACIFEEQYECIKDGNIEECRIERRMSRKLRKTESEEENTVSDDASVTTPRNTGDDVSSFKNEENVYKVEKKSMENIFRSSSPICVLDTDESVFLKCSTDPHNSEFACFSPDLNEIKRCEAYRKTDIIILACVDNDDFAVSACDIFHSSLLCFINDDKIQICSRDMPAVCLNEGNLEPCPGSAADPKPAPPEESATVEESEIYFFQLDRIEVKQSQEVSEYQEDKTEFFAQMPSSILMRNEKFIRKRLDERRDKSHMFLTHLCVGNKQKNDLVNCDKTENVDFACVGIRSGKRKECSKFSGERNGDLALPLCSMGPKNQLTTCGFFDKMFYCLDPSHKGALRPCVSTDENAVCHGKKNQPTLCNEGQSLAQFFKGLHERFMRLHCSDCSIDNTPAVEDTLDGVVTEAEVIKFKFEE